MIARPPAPVLALALALALSVGLGSCSAQAPGEVGGGPFRIRVDVNTPELRAAKRQAGIADCPTVDSTGQQPGGLPDLVLACLAGGREVNLSGLRGPLVVNLWASWCGPCREELPYYQQLHEQAGERVAVLGIDYEDTQPDAALEVAAEAGVTYPLLADPGGAVRVPFRVARGLPGVVFVDEQGTITHIEYLVIDSYEQLSGLVDEHLGVRL